MSDTFERLYNENVKLKEEAEANELLTKTLTDEQAKWVEGLQAAERVKDGLQAALKRYRDARDPVDAIDLLLEELEALCT